MNVSMVGRPNPVLDLQFRPADTSRASGRRIWAADQKEKGGIDPQLQSTAVNIANELIGVRHMARGQQLPITEELHNKIHTFFHRFHEMTEDGEICEAEQEEVLDTLDALTMESEYVADSFSQGLATMRRGFESAMAVQIGGRIRNKARAA